MKKFLFIMLVLCAAAGTVHSQDLKVYISVDMEGLAGLVTGDETSRSGKDYGKFRKIAAKEVNAAIEGALAAGATEIIVRDGHGGKRNILPGDLNRNAKHLRGTYDGPENMMIGIDDSFDAVIFIGYHAKAGTPDAILDHTSTGNVTDLSINGVSLPEAGYNALLAGLHDVPVAFVAGDRAICDHCKELFGDVGTAALKDGIGQATLSVHPDVAFDMIKSGVEESLKKLGNYKPYKMTAPYTMVLKMKNEHKVYNAQFFPGAKRTGDWEITFTSDDFLEVMHAFNKIK